jgi:hypothetical protein
MSRALRSAVSDLLGEPRLRGADLLAALEEAGRAHGAEPFEVCLAMLPIPRRAPGEPRHVVAGIETHRSGLERRLGRDPGFVVAAVDFLQGADGRAWNRAAPAARASARDARGRETVGSFEEGLCAELRRCRRSRRPLSLILLVPVQDLGREALDRAETALAEALRDSDRLGRLVPPAFAIALPESDGAAAGRAAARLGRIAARAAAAPFRCGLSVAGAGEDDGEVLLSSARRSLERQSIDPEAGPFPERRRHRRSPAVEVRARLLRDDSTRDIEVLDLSSVGARVRDGDLEEGTAVRLSLLGPSPKADAATLPARVASRRISPDDDQAVLIFDEGDPGLAELATLLSGLPRGPREGRS